MSWRNCHASIVIAHYGREEVWQTWVLPPELRDGGKVARIDDRQMVGAREWTAGVWQLTWFDRQGTVLRRATARLDVLPPRPPAAEEG